MTEDPEAMGNALDPPQEPAWDGFLEQISFPAFLHDDQFRLRAANRAYLAQAGCSWAEAAGRPYYTVFPLCDGPLTGCAQTLHDEVERTDRFQVDGTTLVSFSFRLAEEDSDGRPGPRSGHLLLPVQEWESLRERELATYQRGLRAIWKSNHVLLHSECEADLYQQVCDVALAEVGYQFAWLALLEGEGDEGHNLAVKAHSGAGSDYLAELDLEGSAADRHLHPAWEVVRSGQTLVLRDIANNPEAGAWTPEAAARGLGGVFATPLLARGKVSGVLCIYSDKPDDFGPMETAVLEELASDLGFGIASLRTRADLDASLERVESALVTTIHSIARVVEERDPYTAGHQERVADLATAIAKELGYDANTIRGLRLGAWIHDLGKVKIPADVLNKPGRLSEAEFALVQEHVAAGQRILADADFPWPILDMIGQHHERLDGSGYPAGLSGDAIIPEARILMVADVVEAIASHRPYRPAQGLDKALEILRAERGTRLDGMAVDACLALMEEGRFAWPNDNGA